jgi:hypothetical protein
MAYQSADRSRYVVPVLEELYSALEVYSWPLVRAATGFFFLPHGMQKLFGSGAAIQPRPPKVLLNKDSALRFSGPITSGSSSLSAEFYRP